MKAVRLQDTEGNVVGTAAAIDLVLPPGTHTFTLTVDDGIDGSSSDSVDVSVLDTTPPELSEVPAPITVEQASLDGTALTVPLPTAADICDPAPSVTSNAPAVFPPGTTTVTFTATDASGNQATATTTVTVTDTTAPSISDLRATPRVLFPRNHKMVPVRVSVNVSDICDEAPKCKIVSVSSNEPVVGTRGRHTSPDWVITGDLTLDLRAELAPRGNGRVYRINSTERLAFPRLASLLLHLPPNRDVR